MKIGEIYTENKNSKTIDCEVYRWKNGADKLLSDNIELALDENGEPVGWHYEIDGFYVVYVMDQEEYELTVASDYDREEDWRELADLSPADEAYKNPNKVIIIF